MKKFKEKVLFINMFAFPILVACLYSDVKCLFDLFVLIYCFISIACAYLYLQEK